MAPLYGTWKVFAPNLIFSLNAWFIDIPGMFLARHKVWRLRSFLRAPRVSLLKLTKKVLFRCFSCKGWKLYVTLLCNYWHLVARLQNFCQMSTLHRGLISVQRCQICFLLQVVSRFESDIWPGELLSLHVHWRHLLVMFVGEVRNKSKWLPVRHQIQPSNTFFIHYIYCMSLIHISKWPREALQLKRR